MKFLSRIFGKSPSDRNVQEPTTMEFLSSINGRSPSDRNTDVSGKETVPKFGESPEETEEELTREEYFQEPTTMEFLSSINGRSPSDRNTDVSGKETVPKFGESPEETEEELTREEYFSGNETMQKLGESSEETEKELTKKEYIDLHEKLHKESWQAARRGDKRIRMILEEKIAAESENVDEEAENINVKTDELLKNSDTDLKVTETVLFMKTMTGEVLEQKSRLTMNGPEIAGRGWTKEGHGVRERENGTFLPLNSDIAIAGQQNITLESRPCDHYIRDNASPGSLPYNTIQSDARRDKMYAHDIGVVQCVVTNSNGSVREVCSDVKKYLKQIIGLVQERIESLPEEVRNKQESVIQGFRRLIDGMRKLLLYVLLLHELKSLLTSFLNEHVNISRKKGRLKYGFQFAAMLALRLSHDVEPNPGPIFSVRACLERITRKLSEVLKGQLPVDGSLWSESVAEAAYAAGYSTYCQWTNPSGNSKDKMTPLIERATELGRLLTEMDCLPSEFAPFISDLENCKVQEQLVIHYKVEHYKTAVDTLLGVCSFSYADTQIILQKTERLTEKFNKAACSSERYRVNFTRSSSPDFSRLADSSILHPNDACQEISHVAVVHKSQSSTMDAVSSDEKSACYILPTHNRETSSCELPRTENGTLVAETISLQDTDMVFGELLKWLEDKGRPSLPVLDEDSTNTGASGNTSLSLVQSQSAYAESMSHSPTRQGQDGHCLNNADTVEDTPQMTTPQYEPEDILGTDQLELLPDVPMSSSNIQNSTPVTQEHEHVEMLKNCIPARNNHEIMELLNLPPDQSSSPQSFPLDENVQINSGMEVSVSMVDSEVNSFDSVDGEEGQNRKSSLVDIASDYSGEEDILAETNNEEDISCTSYAPARIDEYTENDNTVPLKVTENTASTFTDRESTTASTTGPYRYQKRKTPLTTLVDLTNTDITEYQIEPDKQTTSETITHEPENRDDFTPVKRHSPAEARDNESEVSKNLTDCIHLSMTGSNHQHLTHNGHFVCSGTSIPAAVDKSEGPMTQSCHEMVSDDDRGKEDDEEASTSRDTTFGCQLQTSKHIEEAAAINEINTIETKQQESTFSVGRVQEDGEDKVNSESETDPLTQRTSHLNSIVSLYQTRSHGSKSIESTEVCTRRNETGETDVPVTSPSEGDQLQERGVEESEYDLFKSSILRDIEKFKESVLKELDSRYPLLRADLKQPAFTGDTRKGRNVPSRNEDQEQRESCDGSNQSVQAPLRKRKLSCSKYASKKRKE